MFPVTDRVRVGDMFRLCIGFDLGSRLDCRYCIQQLTIMINYTAGIQAVTGSYITYLKQYRYTGGYKAT